MPDAVNRWIVCFTGYRQEGRTSGVEKIQDAIHRKCNCDTTRVLLDSWKDSTGDLANRMWNRCPEAGQPAVVIIGYSFGGWTAVLLANELRKRNWSVEHLLLIDQVWRPISWLPSPSSLLANWTIDVPNNVKVVYEWRQKVSRPYGHRVVTCSRTTHYEQTLMLPHHLIDDDPGIFDKALKVACPEMTAEEKRV